MTMLKVNVAQEEMFPSPLALSYEIPQSLSSVEFIEESRKTIRNILKGQDCRKLLILGPCSIHDPDSALEYAEKLKQLAEDVKETFFVVMRVYLEKARSIRGWKGFLSDPKLDGSNDLAYGLRRSRTLLNQLTDLRLPIGGEILELHTPNYLAEFYSWGCIGARTSTSQPHRELASNLPFPVGFKNTIDGSVAGAINGILSAQESHSFLGFDAEGQLSKIDSRGNSDCHVILRGGEGHSNYDAKSVEKATSACLFAGVRPNLIIDCSHDNCGKKHERQVAVFENVMEQIASGNERICGLMLESHLLGGAQPLRFPLKYGVSITDPCLSFETTRELVLRAVKTTEISQLSR